MPPSFERHLAALRKGEHPLPCYAVVSSESVLVSEAVADLRKLVLKRAPDFNRDEFRAGEAALGNVIEAAKTLPMMADRRWVHVADFHRLKAKDQQVLLAYLEQPSPQSVLCLSGSKLDGRTKLGKRLAKSGGAFTLEPPRQQALASWLQARAKRAGSVLEVGAAELLADLIGPDVGILDRTLEMLALYAGGGQPIDSEHIEATVAPVRVHSIFELTDAIGARDLTKASALLRNALGGGESGLMVLAMMTRQFRHLLQFRTLRALGKTPGEIAQALGIRPFVVQALGRQAQRYQNKELVRAIVAASRADIRLKSTRLGAGVILDGLLVEVMESA